MRDHACTACSDMLLITTLSWGSCSCSCQNQVSISIHQEYASDGCRGGALMMHMIKVIPFL